MSLQDVKADYLQELKVLQTWKTRMDLASVANEEPPEFKMSNEYKAGWKKYLDAVLSISQRMIAKCQEAEVGDNNDALIDILEKEAVAYDNLALEASKQNVELTELVTMLKHEAQSRREIIDDL